MHYGEIKLYINMLVVQNAFRLTAHHRLVKSRTNTLLVKNVI